MHSYLDSNELAETLGIKLQTVRRNAIHAPWRLPPRARLLESRMLRWRADEVERWQREQDASGPLMRSSR